MDNISKFDWFWRKSLSNWYSGQKMYNIINFDMAYVHMDGWTVNMSTEGGGDNLGQGG